MRASRPGVAAVYFICLPRSILTNEVGNLLAINLWCRESQLLLESLLQHADIPVFAKHERNDEPIISRTYLTIRAPIPLEGSLAPSRNLRRRPAIALCFFVVRRGLMMGVAGGQDFALSDRLRCFSY